MQIPVEANVYPAAKARRNPIKVKHFVFRVCRALFKRKEEKKAARNVSQVLTNQVLANWNALRVFREAHNLFLAMQNANLADPVPSKLMMGSKIV